MRIIQKLLLPILTKLKKYSSKLKGDIAALEGRTFLDLVKGLFAKRPTRVFWGLGVHIYQVSVIRRSKMEVKAEFKNFF